MLTIAIRGSRASRARLILSGQLVSIHLKYQYYRFGVENTNINDQNLICHFSGVRTRKHDAGGIEKPSTLRENERLRMNKDRLTDKKRRRESITNTPPMITTTTFNSYQTYFLKKSKRPLVFKLTKAPIPLPTESRVGFT